MLSSTFQIQQVTCQVKTISEIIHEQGIQQIDLLKVYWVVHILHDSVDIADVFSSMDAVF